MKFLIFTISVIVTFILFFNLGYLFLSKFKSGNDTAILRVGNATFEVEIADNPLLTAKGLSGRDVLSEGHGMLFVFSHPRHYPFWMKAMKFPLDFIWIRNKTVVGIDPNVPVRYGVSSFKTVIPREPVDMVLEINAGEAKKVGIQKGDEIKLRQK
ncbi:MAG: DUF192 domain-containing protein [Patescibacteria group bacterium]|nr:DUF192 domain-containing protein [Patescibacteria group bacterium]